MTGAPCAGSSSGPRVCGIISSIRARGVGRRSTPTRSDAPAALGSKSDPRPSIKAENRWRNSLSLHLVVPLSTDLPPSKGTPTRAETETTTDLVPEDVLSGPLVDVPDAVRGDFREPGGGRGGRERPKRPPGDDLRPRRQGRSEERRVGKEGRARGE